MTVMWMDKFKSYLKLSFESSDAIVIEQHKTLSKQLPPLYLVVFLTSLGLIASYKNTAPDWLALYIPALLMGICLARLYYWVSSRNKIDNFSLQKRIRDLRMITFLASGFGLSYTMIGIALFQFGETHQVTEAAFLILTTAYVGAYCMSCLPKASIATIFFSSVPLIISLLFSGDRTLTIFSVILVPLTLLVAFMLLNSYHSFANLLKSKIEVAEKHEEAEKAREEVSFIAFTDVLTGIPNRYKFFHLLEEHIEVSRQQKNCFAVGMLDLDGFKAVNDLYGHAGGDSVLSQVAKRLERIMENKGRVARLGGDEFAILFDNAATATQVHELGETINEALQAPFSISGRSAILSASLGFSFYPENGQAAITLMEYADQALYAAKTSGRSITSIFNRSIEKATLLRSKIEQELRIAIIKDEIEVHFQPIIDMQTGDYLSFEALARWFHPEMGYVQPSTFIEIAEQAGLIESLTNNLLRKAARVAKHWPSHIKLSFNLSAEHLNCPSAGLNFLSILTSAGLPPNRLEVEITETAIMKDIDKALLTIENLNMVGINIVLDDFGTGHSSLSQIRDLPLDKIKIDKSFIDNICTDKKVRSIVRSIFDLSSNLDLKCVAEGIETVEQCNTLIDCGGQLGQGYLFSKAVEAHESISYFRTNQSSTKTLSA